jgi:uncharacterized membrane protein YkoI
MNRPNLLALLLTASALLLSACASNREREVNPAGPPPNIVASFERQFPGATIEKIEQDEKRDGRMQYEIQYRDTRGKKRHIEMDAAGRIVD